MTLTPMEQYEKFVRDAGGTKVIKRIVVANNGMAATKFIMSIRNWLFENFGDDRLIHIVAMATPEVSRLSARHHCARTLTLVPPSSPAQDMKAHAAAIAAADVYYEVRRHCPSRSHRLVPHAPTSPAAGARWPQLQQLRERERHRLGRAALRGRRGLARLGPRLGEPGAAAHARGGAPPPTALSARRAAAGQRLPAVLRSEHLRPRPPAPRAHLPQMGITFIGPNETSMFLLGDKIASTIIAQSAGVPCISWSGSGVDVVADAEGKVTSMDDATFARACVNTAEEAVEVAERVGYPIMIKASEGGGGKGVRKAKCRADIIPMFRQVADEVKGSPIFLMRLCDGARHIEVQVMADKHRNVSILSGRDCSMQRRFQKIVEEGPPIAVKPETMRQMELAAQLV